MFEDSEMMERIPSPYPKDQSGVIGKIIHLLVSPFKETQQVSEDLRSVRDMDIATGVNLDKIGSNVSQNRGQLEDSLFRVLIRSKIARNLSNGSINSLIQVLSMVLKTEMDNIVIVEKYILDDPEPAALRILIPSPILNSTGISVAQFSVLMDRVLPAGVSCDALYTGTFQFSSSPDTPDSGHGNGFNEGTLGEYYNPSDNTPLPL